MRVLRELRHQVRWALPVWFVSVITSWWPDNRITIRLRGWLMGLVIPTIGRGFQLGAGVTLLSPDTLVIGRDVYVARGCWLNALGRLELKDEVVLGPYVVISTAQHVFRNGSVRFGGSVVEPVSIGKGSWLAAHAAVKCGVTIGTGCLVAANSAVTKDVPDRTMVGGVPAKVLGPVEDGIATLASREDRRQGPA